MEPELKEAPLEAAAPGEKEIESERRASREMRFAILTIVLACVFVFVAIALVVVIGHIQIF